MATYIPAKRATEYIFYMGLVSQATGQFQANPTLAAGDVKVSKDGGALANLTTLPAVTPAASKMVKVTVSATEMTADNVTLVFSDAAGAEWDDCIVNIQTSALQIDDLATPTNITAGTITTVTNLTNLPAITSNWLTAAGIAAGALNGKGDWNIGKTGYSLTATTGLGNQTANITGNLSGSVGSVSGNVGGNVVGSVGSVVGAVGSVTGLTPATVHADLDDIQSRLPAALSANGNMKADIKEIEDQLTSGYNATLKLKKIDIFNNDVGGICINVDAGGVNGRALYLDADGTGGTALELYSNNVALLITGHNTNEAIGIYNSIGSGVYLGAKTYGVDLEATDNDALYLGSISGKSINAPQDIALPSGDLDDQLQALPTAAENADANWEETLADHSGTVGSTAEQLAAAGAAGDPWNTALPGAYASGKAGYILGTNLNATVSSRSSHSAADIWAVGTRTLTSFGSLIADIWTNVTRTLTAFSFTVDTNANATETAIKAKTDQLTFTNAGEVDANVQAVNDTELTGDGSTTPWGPV